MCKSETLTFFCIAIFFAVFWGAYLAYFFSTDKYDTGTLRLVHVLLRHGERHPDKVSICPNNPYYDEKYYPEGYGQLNTIGKKTEYNIGTYLRARYNDFLSPIWNIKDIEARSTDYNRTKMSLQLVLAGLYPPKGFQVWSPLSWQPIPYNYISKLQDKEMLPYYACPRYIDIMNKLYEEPEVKNYLKRYEEAFGILADRCGRRMDIEQAFNLYVGFKIQEELGYPLEEWTEAVYPEPLHSAVIDMYYFMTNTTKIKRIITGYFLKKLLTDTQAKINNTILPKERKLFIYSAHEMNLATTLILLGIHEKTTDIPPYGSYMLFEVHYIDGVYGFKIFYQDYKQANPIPLKIHGCDYFCPYDDFYMYMERFLPKNDEECFGNLIPVG